MKELNGSGQYKAPTTGELVAYDFTFPVFESLDDAIEVLGADKVLKNVQRMAKLDANNTSREKAKTANGHSTRKVMSEEDKAEAKAQRAKIKTLTDAIKGKGLSIDDLLAQL